MIEQACQIWIVQGDSLRDAGNAAQAAEAYQRAIELAPHLGWVHVQLGNMLKDTGRFFEAEVAYRTALNAGADVGDTNLQLGRALKLAGQRDQALIAFTRALKATPNSADAVREIISLGESWTVQQTHGLGVVSITDAVAALESIKASLRRIEQHVPDMAKLAAIPPKHWNLWRRLWQRHAPPNPGLPLGLIMLADNTPLPAFLACLRSLEAQAGSISVAMVVSADAEVLTAVSRRAAVSPVPLHGIDQPMSSNLASKLEAVLAQPALAAVEWVTIIDQPLILDRDAMLWLSNATADNPAGVFCDEDTVSVSIDQSEGDWERSAPLLKGAADPELVEQGYSLGALLVVRKEWLRNTLPKLKAMHPGPIDGAGWVGLQTLLMLEGTIKLVSHVLASRVDSIVAARPTSTRVGQRVSLSVAPKQACEQIIEVIIPTRDNVDLLEACITSLRANAEQPRDCLVTVVDNNSNDPSTSRYLDIARRSGVLHRVVRIDEPFNWSRLNNQAVARGNSSLVVFANNDLEMTSKGWDSLLRNHLARSDVGVVGARLLYSDRSIQHAGIVLGTDGGGCEHEGRNAAAEDGGPQNRWLTRRSVAAVTGAFLACRRMTFENVGGFDETRFGIWFNDVHFCLQVRELGMRVVYEPAIEAIHYESKTLAVEFRDSARNAHFAMAAAAMREHWQEAFTRDPYFNPHYARWGTPFAWLRSPSAA